MRRSTAASWSGSGASRGVRRRGPSHREGAEAAAARLDDRLRGRGRPRAGTAARQDDAPIREKEAVIADYQEAARALDAQARTLTDQLASATAFRARQSENLREEIRRAPA